MVRVQISLTDEQARALERLAARRGVSKAEIIRGAVEHILREDWAERWERASALIGRYRSNETDVARNHDAYLDEAYLGE